MPLVKTTYHCWSLVQNGVLSWMSKKYIHLSGGPPINEIVRVPNQHAPMHVYCFNFLKQIACLLSNHDLIKDSLWGYNPQIHPDSGERAYAEMNAGDLWKLGKEHVMNGVNHPPMCESAGQWFPNWSWNCQVLSCLPSTVQVERWMSEDVSNSSMSQIQVLKAT
jgi:hypothetical protein